MSKQRILLLGGGSHCKSVIDVIEQTGEFEIIGIIDLPEKIGQEILGYPIIGDDERIDLMSKEFDGLHISFGKLDSSEKRSGVFRQLKDKGYHFPVIISPLAYVSRHAFIGEGTIIMHQAVVNAGAHVGKNCIVNTKSLIEHDAVVGDYCHIATGAIINGGVKVGNESFVGSGSVSKQNSVIPYGSFIKANSIVK